MRFGSPLFRFETGVVVDPAKNAAIRKRWSARTREKKNSLFVRLEFFRPPA
jgi:hypothetical protein